MHAIQKQSSPGFPGFFPPGVPQSPPPPSPPGSCDGGSVDVSSIRLHIFLGPPCDA